MNTPNSPAGASGTNDSYTLPAQTKERPILFSGEMVRAILDGKKTQTRRVAKGVALEWLDDAGFDPEFVAKDNDLCPYGKVGDRLWVRETHSIKEYDFDYHVTYFADGETKIFKSNVSGMFTNKKTRPSIHMPRHFSRINLEITDIRVERIQDISDNDIESEGVEVFGDSIVRKTLFTDLWNKINKKRGCGWDKNPWVWVVTFKRV